MKFKPLRNPPVLPLPGTQTCSTCQRQTKVSRPNPLLTPCVQHTKLMRGEENSAPLVARAGLTSASHPTTGDSRGKEVGRLFGDTRSFQAIQVLATKSFMAKPGNPSAEPIVSRNICITCTLANDRSPDKQQPQTLSTFHSSGAL